ncbi:glycosyltransferase [Phaeovulum vinaykumarii]|uniref:Glycosyltransferase involved in cell wall bisynthesis n=1 Tax=Phaeovulum vinaykumarii TaxID=407234 RepID=A0A1N7N308_9RHOB|nr:hypothetical protein [Phaeovulum vinaykumarii]SIS92766.1 Glycosyltransferase involved in cell wall bisynthesis [Phaeovulum vinaykumarii]SOC19064.1 glycosyltransferase involved in cell wall bisynthesis [Phaeovulum vinaykumarii]
MPVHNPHRGLDPLVTEIQRRNDPRLGIAFAWRFADLLPPKLGPLRRIGEYVELAFRIWGQRQRQTILVREFSTYFFFLTLVLVFPLRRKCLLLIAHNVQSAERKPIEKQLLKVLSRLGLRFACLESDAGVQQVLGLHDAVVFPHPVVSVSNQSAASIAARPHRTVVGVAGDPRPEKGLDRVIPYLDEALRDREDIAFRVGTNRVVEAQSRWPKAQICDTSAQSDYMAFLEDLDILVLPYPEQTYRFRVSGVIAEATGCGTATICTDLPCLRQQVLAPAVGGTVLAPDAFTTPNLLAAIEALSAQRESLREALCENAKFRQPQAVVDTILGQLAR